MLVTAGCGGSTTAESSASPSTSPLITAQPTPSSNNGETPVEKHVLAPSQDLPVAMLCTTAITVSADGNATPLACRSGALNVQAWRFYASVSASVLGIGLNPTQGQVESAMCDDLKRNHATRTEELSGYKLATLYYGWTFNIDPTTLSCSQ